MPRSDEEARAHRVRISALETHRAQPDHHCAASSPTGQDRAGGPGRVHRLGGLQGAPGPTNRAEHAPSRRRTAQGRALLGLSRKLLTITTTDRTAQWPAALNDYTTEYRSWLNQRTTAEQAPATAARGRTWWYTHAHTRRTHKRLERPAEQGALFAHLTGPAGEPHHTPPKKACGRARAGPDAPTDPDTPPKAPRSRR